MRRAVFLDRDGVLVVPEFRDGRSYAVQSLKNFKLYPDALKALNLLKEQDFLLIVITNQPDVGRGIIRPEIMDEMNSRLMKELPLDLIKTCTHIKEDCCSCRKPFPGLLRDACKQLDIDSLQSYMIGDRSSDVEAGQSMGCKTVFIDHNYTSEEKPVNFDFSVKTLIEAVFWIIKDHKVYNK